MRVLIALAVLAVIVPPSAAEAQSKSRYPGGGVWNHYDDHSIVTGKTEYRGSGLWPHYDDRRISVGKSSLQGNTFYHRWTPLPARYSTPSKFRDPTRDGVDWGPFSKAPAKQAQQNKQRLVISPLVKRPLANKAKMDVAPKMPGQEVYHRRRSMGEEVRWYMHTQRLGGKPVTKQQARIKMKMRHGKSVTATERIIAGAGKD